MARPKMKKKPGRHQKKLVRLTDTVRADDGAPQLKRLLTDRDVEDEYQLSQARLRKSRVYIARGDQDAGPPYVKYGRSVYYLRASLEAWIAARQSNAEGK